MLRKGVLPVLLLLAGCRDTLPGPAEMAGVTFTLAQADTRSTGSADEGAVGDWALLLFREGRLEDYGTAGADAPIRCALQAGTYEAVAVANPPASFQPGKMTTLQTFLTAESRLEDNAPSRLVMTGRQSAVVRQGDSNSLEISVKRLVCKAGIRKISVDLTNPVLAARPFVLKALYLTNCYGRTTLGNDPDESGISPETSAWYNRMGFLSDPKADALLSDPSIGTTLTPDAPYQKEHVFYFYPNPVENDRRDGDWSPRPTRLVIEAEIGARTYYYPVTLPVSRRNRTYLIEEAVIRKPGSVDPEGNEPGSIDITFRTLNGDWNPVFDVQENS